MFDEKVNERISLLDKNLVEISDTDILLIESHKEGNAKLKILTENPTILFCDLENKKLHYFSNQKCADYVVFENVQGVWWTHIFELKRTVRESNWEEIKDQFAGALQNVLALAGVLGIEIQEKNTRVYTVYRNDKLNDYANPVRIRGEMYKRAVANISKEHQDWNNDKIGIEKFFGNIYQHVKVPLDVETGEGSHVFVH